MASSVEHLDRISSTPKDALPWVDLSRLSPAQQEQLAHALMDTTVAGRLGLDNPANIPKISQEDSPVARQDREKVARNMSELGYTTTLNVSDEEYKRIHEQSIGFVGSTSKAGAIKSVGGRIAQAVEGFETRGEGVLQGVERTTGVRLDFLRAKVPKVSVDYVGKPLAQSASELEALAKTWNITETGARDLDFVRKLESVSKNETLTTIGSQIAKIDEQLLSEKPNWSIIMNQVDLNAGKYLTELRRAGNLIPERMRDGASIVHQNAELQELLGAFGTKLSSFRATLTNLEQHLTTMISSGVKFPAQSIQQAYLEKVQALLRTP